MKEKEIEVKGGLGGMISGIIGPSTWESRSRKQAQTSNES